jgi:hypothetical protein
MAAVVELTAADKEDSNELLYVEYDRSTHSSSDQVSSADSQSDSNTHRYVNVDYPYEQAVSRLVFDSTTSSTPNVTSASSNSSQTTPSRKNNHTNKTNLANSNESSDTTPTTSTTASLTATIGELNINVTPHLNTTPSLNSIGSANTSNTNTQTSGSRFLAIRNWLKPNRWRKSKDKTSNTTTPTKYAADSPLSTSLQTGGGAVEQTKATAAADLKLNNKQQQQPETPLIPSTTRTKTNYYTSPFQIFNSLDSKSKKRSSNTKVKKSGKNGKKNGDENGGGNGTTTPHGQGVGMSTICVANSTIINTLYSTQNDGHFEGAANNHGQARLNGSGVVFSNSNTSENHPSSSPNATRHNSNLTSNIQNTYFLITKESSICGVKVL